MHAGAVKPHLRELLDLADAQFLGHLCLLSGLNRPFPARSVTIQSRLGPVKSGQTHVAPSSEAQKSANYPRPLAF
jgi:hypothetical protein